MAVASRRAPREPARAGTPFSLVGAITRYYYGPDSMYAKFEADTCHRSIDFPQSAPVWELLLGGRHI